MSIDITESREHLAAFLSKNEVGVLATASKDGTPHAATIYITHDRQFNIYFITKKDTQKSRNLQENPRAAIAIYEPVNQTTVQVEGSVVEVTEPQIVEWVFNDIWRIALNSSFGHVPPTTRLAAGGYVVYRLAGPYLRMATFIPQDPSDYEKVFEIIPTQPS